MNQRMNTSLLTHNNTDITIVTNDKVVEHYYSTNNVCYELASGEVINKSINKKPTKWWVGAHKTPLRLV